MGDLTREEALEILWVSKTPPWTEPVFLWADLVEDTEMRIWFDHGVPEEHRMAKAGQTILVTVVSRFGDVGIRDDRLNPPSHGYHARVTPDKLTNWRHIPDDAPHDWTPPTEEEREAEMQASMPIIIPVDSGDA